MICKIRLYNTYLSTNSLCWRYLISPIFLLKGKIMTKFKNYFNAISGDERIFSREDIANMTNTEYKNNEKAINYQLTNIGVPTNKELKNSENVVYVKAYTKDDGTNVKAHYRSKPDNKLTNNLSYIANIEKENIKVKDFKNKLFEFSHDLFLSENSKNCEKCKEKNSTGSAIVFKGN